MQFSFKKLKSYIENKNIDIDIKNKILSDISHAEYIDRCILGTSNFSSHQEDTQLANANKVYKKMLRLYRSRIIKNLNLIDQSIK